MQISFVSKYTYFGCQTCWNIWNGKKHAFHALWKKYECMKLEDMINTWPYKSQEMIGTNRKELHLRSFQLSVLLQHCWTTERQGQTKISRAISDWLPSSQFFPGLFVEAPKPFSVPRRRCRRVGRMILKKYPSLIIAYWFLVVKWSNTGISWPWKTIFTSPPGVFCSTLWWLYHFFRWS